MKGKTQQGLVAELIAGRLADKLGAGPLARIIRVAPESLPPADQLPPTFDPTELVGVVVGSADVPGAENARDLQQFIGSGQFRPGLIDPASRSLAITFQTWLGVGDQQVLVRLTDGTVFSIDHGECFGSTATLADPTIVLVNIPGLSSDVGRERSYMQLAVDRIEAVTDNDLFRAVDSVPIGAAWRSEPERRLEIIRWLAYRRDKLRKVMEAWMLP